jgi:hypothetical protein
MSSNTGVSVDDPEFVTYKQQNIDTMTDQLNQEETTLLTSGVSARSLVYVVKNWPIGDKQSDKLGAYFYQKTDALDVIQNLENAKWVPLPPQTTFQCRVVDGRNVPLLVDMLEEFDEEDHSEYLQANQLEALSIQQG